MAVGCVVGYVITPMHGMKLVCVEVEFLVVRCRKHVLIAGLSVLIGSVLVVGVSGTV